MRFGYQVSGAMPAWRTNGFGKVQPLSVNGGQRLPISQLQDDPLLKSFLKNLPALLQALTIGPKAAETRDFAEIRLILEQLVAGARHGRVDVGRQGHDPSLTVAGSKIK